MRDKEELQKYISPEALEEIARMLDTYDKLALEFLVPYLRGELLNPDMGKSWNEEFADKLEAWASGDSVQRDLRRWATEDIFEERCDFDCNGCHT
jgi:hypothetical protein